MCSGNDDCGSVYENGQLLEPRRERRRHEHAPPFDAVIAAAEMSLSPAWMFAAPARERRASTTDARHRARRASGRSRSRSRTPRPPARDPSTFGDEMMMCRPLIASGKWIDVVSKTTIGGVIAAHASRERAGARSRRCRRTTPTRNTPRRPCPWRTYRKWKRPSAPTRVESSGPAVSDADAMDGHPHAAHRRERALSRGRITRPSHGARRGRHGAAVLRAGRARSPARAREHERATDHARRAAASRDRPHRHRAPHIAALTG